MRDNRRERGHPEKAEKCAAIVKINVILSAYKFTLLTEQYIVVLANENQNGFGLKHMQHAHSFKAYKLIKIGKSAYLFYYVLRVIASKTQKMCNTTSGSY